MNEPTDLAAYFDAFRRKIVGIDASFESPYGAQKIVYADWIASGRLYGPIEEAISGRLGPMVGNTHSYSSQTGSVMSEAYSISHQLIKAHVNASDDDVILTTGFGMTSALAKFQRILGLKLPERLLPYCELPMEERPVVFLTHMEHHSNHTPWLESLADVVVLDPDDDLLVDPRQLEKEIVRYKSRKLKIGSFSACSNVTGIETPYHLLAEIMHAHGGVCFVDFAASAPYVAIDMHPANRDQKLDAIFFSPHKFLGGPGGSGVLIFDRQLYQNRIPDHPGGGTVLWTNPWGEHSYVDDIEVREDGGTPGVLQSIKAALAVRLKDKMGVQYIAKREQALTNLAFTGFNTIRGLHLLAGESHRRLGVFSFFMDGIHHNLIVKLLNDRFGIQVRGGCSCAGTYGHYLLHVTREASQRITSRIDQGDLSGKPGWVRISLHPTTTEDEILYIVDALKMIRRNADQWSREYNYDPASGEFEAASPTRSASTGAEALFTLS